LQPRSKRFEVAVINLKHAKTLRTG